MSTTDTSTTRSAEIDALSRRALACAAEAATLWTRGHYQASIKWQTMGRRDLSTVEAMMEQSTLPPGQRGPWPILKATRDILNALVTAEMGAA